MRADQPIAPWAHAESAGAGCGDARLTTRLGILLTAMGNASTASIPAAFAGGHAEIAAAYRFFDNPAACPEHILTAHHEQTRRRSAAHGTVLLVQDTTEIDMTQPQLRVRGAGPLDGTRREGALLHLLQAFSPQGVPLGSLWNSIITRPPKQERKPMTRHQLRNAPIQDKESSRWLEGMEQAHALARQQPSQRVICMADSEADIYEYLRTALGSCAAGRCADWIVRACQDRKVQAAGCGATKLWDACRQQPLLYEQAVQVRGRKAPQVACDKRSRHQPREDRDIHVAVRATTVTLGAPQRPGGRAAPITVNAVLVSEIDPPPDDVPVEWLLLSSLPVDSEQAVREIVEAYRKRFLIEVFFRVLKSGCCIEQRRFESCHRHLSALAVALIIAWRVHSLSQVAQQQPEASAQDHFEPVEWQAAWGMVNRAKPPPSSAPTMGEMARLVAKLGGWIQRGGKSYSPPGVQTLWQGLQRLSDLATAWSLARQKTCV